MTDAHADAGIHGHAPGHADHAPKHPYHLVDPSPWPIVGAISAGLLATGGVLFMHGHGAILMIIGFIAVPATMALFIASEVMFFSAFFWAFFSAALYPADGVWPPKGIHPFDPFEFPFLNTLILLLSGTTVTWAHHSLLEGNQKGLIQGLVVTVLLGLSFTSIQAYEYAHAAFTFTGGIYPSTFFMATGFHGFHVIVGTIFLAVCLWRATQGHFTPDHHFGLEAAAWYWHFVDVVWLFLFVCIYWWGMGNAVPLGE
jgi:cytochrome c oxidase subunit 3